MTPRLNQVTITYTHHHKIGLLEETWLWNYKRDCYCTTALPLLRRLIEVHSAERQPRRNSVD
jgi:hypothetical protein